MCNIIIDTCISINSIQAKEFNVDSLLKSYNFDRFLLVDQILEKTKVVKNKTIEFYKPISKKNDQIADSIILTYNSDYKQVDFFTFSKKLDSKKKRTYIAACYCLVHHATPLSLWEKQTLRELNFLLS